MVWNKILPYSLKRKIEKTNEARAGKGIYKRRNNRNYRVIIHFTTYKKLFENDKNFLDNYKQGYIIRLKPTEYHHLKKMGEIGKYNIKLGENAFIYYKSSKALSEFPIESNWNELSEVYSSNAKNKNMNIVEWFGEYALFINNSREPQISEICKSGESSNAIQNENKARIEKYLNLTINWKIPKQRGVGNYDYDYCTKEEMNHINYQLVYLMMKCKDFKDMLYRLCKEDNDKILKFHEDVYKANCSGKFDTYYDDIFQKIEKYCKKFDLIDFDKLNEIRVYDKKLKVPICPLCLKELNASEFLEKANQQDGRVEEDNTRSNIALMHIHALKPGELNHRTYNLGWGHRHCNQIQEDLDLETTIKKLRQIVLANEGLFIDEDSIPVEDLKPRNRERLK
ncbi:BstXI family restriction endonuclease [Macrococcoides caseolyticum]|uniref:BstXI family restriction endonuclease n=1 Tax=Macrococcoides caseolyticum TaxID=69966 RepID=UPI000C34AF4E|nr:BstXI family restriction endonuclease [Macrococcus caseolyticus]PKE50735.1 hypothetical protein CW672_04405 [Macrococcus caseolyticus]